MAGKALCKASSAPLAAGGVPFEPSKGTKNGPRGTDSPLANPFQRAVALDTNGLCPSVLRRKRAPKEPAAHQRPHPLSPSPGGEGRRTTPVCCFGLVLLLAPQFPFFGRPDRASARHQPRAARLAVPEKAIALLACSPFSTAAGAPPRCIRRRRRSAPFPRPPGKSHITR